MKKLVNITLGLVVASTIVTTNYKIAEAKPMPATAIPVTAQIQFNDQPVKEAQGFNVNGTTYVRGKDLAKICYFSFVWDNDERKAVIIDPLGNVTSYTNDQLANQGALQYKGENYFQVRTLASQGAYAPVIDYDSTTKVIKVNEDLRKGESEIKLATYVKTQYQYNQDKQLGIQEGERIKQETANSAPVYLKDIKSLSNSGHAYLWENRKDNLGQTYRNGGLIFEGSREEIVYYTNGQYNYLKGTLVLCEDDKNDTTPRKLYIYGDDRLLYTSPEISKNFIPENISVNISGVQKLKIETECNSYSSSRVGLVDAAFYGNQNTQTGIRETENIKQEAVSGTPVYLKDIKSLSNSGHAYLWENRKDNLGQTYRNGGLIFEGSREEIVYYTNGQYNYLKGTLVLCEDDKNDTTPRKLYIYGDDRLLYTSPEISKNFIPENISVNTSGVQKLKIETECNSYSSSRVGLVDAAFYKN